MKFRSLADMKNNANSCRYSLSVESPDSVSWDDLIWPKIFRDFHNSIAQGTVAKPETADTCIFHLPEIKPIRVWKEPAP